MTTTYLTLEEASKLTYLSESELLDRTYRGVAPIAVKVNNSWVYDPKEINEYNAKQDLIPAKVGATKWYVNRKVVAQEELAKVEELEFQAEVAELVHKQFLEEKKPGDLLSIKQAAELMGITEKTLYARYYAGKEPQPISVDGKIRFKRLDIEAYLADSRRDDLLTVEEAAKIIGIKPKVLYSRACRGLLPRHIKVGKQIRYRKEDVEAYSKENIAIAEAEFEAEQKVKAIEPTVEPRATITITGKANHELLTVNQAAEYLEIPRNMLDMQRSKGVGPNFIKKLVGNKERIFYTKANLDTWQSVKVELPVVKHTQPIVEYSNPIKATPVVDPIKTIPTREHSEDPFVNRLWQMLANAEQVSLFINKAHHLLPDFVEDQAILAKLASGLDQLKAEIYKYMEGQSK